MPFQIFINILIAILWMFLQNSWDTITFISGYIVGIVILYSLRRFVSDTFYLYTLFAAIKLLFVFVLELWTSSILVVKQILKPKMDITPGIFTLETDLEGELELTLLALLISLTPGSVVMEIAPDSNRMYVHAMDIPESKESVLRAQVKFEKLIKEVTR
ncbi:Na+/H+ antiporter subunit E [Sutcliffiella cohnii]|uniref:Na+/H+ antiporter subunit E n=1 Tax=Sutcliffiella cohnii TaxID=33932 RepID=A0A223KSZ3_9BACI|nr:Na+/H+ antiporter subunit E [Sutcliffiella cohnii]AST92576.1 Na+/H+ antiporter subunit E [Sutcliffiella cohnii]